MEILYEDKYYLAVNKEPGVVVQGAKSEEESLLVKVKNYLKKRDQKIGNVFLGVIHRLDKPVSGVVILAKRSKSASKFYTIIQEQRLKKVYLAKVEGNLREKEGFWKDQLSIAGRLKEAHTYYKVIENEKSASLLLLYPFTGRKHQLRIVLAKRGYPIIGDQKYGSTLQVLKGKAILLHSLYIGFYHPYTHQWVEIWASVPKYFQMSIPSSKLKEIVYLWEIIKEST
ncbi:MAG: RluA family pseudouridine synthase [Caldimicrobium sp.]